MQPTINCLIDKPFNVLESYIKQVRSFCASRKLFANCDVVHLGTSSSYGWAATAAWVWLTLWQAGTAHYTDSALVCCELWITYTQPSNASIVFQRHETLIWAKPSNCTYMKLKKLKVSIGSRPQNRRIVVKNKEDKDIVRTKQRRYVCWSTTQNP